MVWNGHTLALKIDGNPYNPFVAVPNIPFNTSPYDVNTVDAAICPKGQSGLQTVYDPYRITKVLKRAGKRGANKWQTIPFDQAINEIVNGGKLFANIPGEENRVVTGLKDIYGWVKPTDLANYDFPEADRPIVEILVKNDHQ